MTLNIGATKGDGKICLNDDGEACKIDKRGVPYKIGSDGRRIVPTRRPKHLYTPEEWDKMDAKAKDKAYKQAKRERAKEAKKDRKRAAVGKKLVDKMLDKMIFPKIVQCNKIDLELGSSCTDGWEWAHESLNNSCRKNSLRMSYQRYLLVQCSMKTGYPLCHVRCQFHPNIVSRIRDMGIVSMPWPHVQLPEKR